jgi:hypothetical protein
MFLEPSEFHDKSLLLSFLMEFTSTVESIDELSPDADHAYPRRHISSQSLMYAVLRQGPAFWFAFV